MLISKQKINFRLISVILDNNKGHLAKLCYSLPLDDKSIKHFVTLILNMSKLRHLHLTDNTQIDKLDNTALLTIKHLVSKDSLHCLIIDRLPILGKEIDGISGLPLNLKILALKIVATKGQSKQYYCSFIVELMKKLYIL